MVMMPDSLAARIKFAREMVDPALSARELSALSGQTSSLIAHIERGVILQPRADTIVRVAEVFGVSLDWLMRGVGKQPTTAAVNAAVSHARDAKRVA